MGFDPFAGVKKLEHEVSNKVHSAAQGIKNAEQKAVEVGKTLVSPITGTVKTLYAADKKLGQVITDLPNEIKSAEHAVVNAGHSLGSYVGSHGGIGGIASSVSKNIGDDISSLIKPTASAVSTPLIAVAVIAVVAAFMFIEIK